LHSHKELERKRPGILKDSSYINSPMTNYRPETVTELQNKQAIRDRIAITVPYSTRNQPTLSSEPSLARLYSPNGLSQAQYNNYTRANEYIRDLLKPILNPILEDLINNTSHRRLKNYLNLDF